MRAIVFLLFVVLIFFIIRFILNRVIQIREHNKKLAEDKKGSLAENTTEAMVRCALCDIHLPQSEAYYDGKDTFCSEGHMHKFHHQKNTTTTED
ncbi:PP0621 family protein [Thiomicrorhabdus arctica]|uniref:PP0621 family protein n=1 Tax=Thiomicrorhabdus arctica TaxID=131540 RepID=UPI00036F8BBA|nr:PP0621 family protein [Thiomicrorhabdus arctica]